MTKRSEPVIDMNKALSESLEMQGRTLAKKAELERTNGDSLIHNGRKLENGTRPPAYKIVLWQDFSVWILVNPSDESQAWSGSRWVPIGGDVQICNFASEQTARDYADAPKIPEPIEQAAPPRPLSDEHEFVQTLCGCAEYCKICEQHVDKHRAPAAIEQARPQPPQCAKCSFPQGAWAVCGEHICQDDGHGNRIPYQHTCKGKSAAAEPAPERTPPQAGCKNSELICTGCQMAHFAEPAKRQGSDDWAYSAAEKIHALFNNASYFSTRNAEHRKQMLEGWAEIIRTARAVAVPEPAAQQPIRTHIVDGQGKCLPDCSGCTVRLFDGTIVGQAEPAPGLADLAHELRQIAVYIQGKGMGNLPVKLCAIARKLLSAEPAPTPSRPSDAQIEKLVSDCKRLAEDCDIAPAFVHTLGNYLKDYKFQAEASAQGTKERREIHPKNTSLHPKNTNRAPERGDSK